MSRPGDLDAEGIANLRKVFPAAIAKIEAEAATTERRLTVEKVREAVEALDYDHQDDHVVLRWIDLAAILDNLATAAVDEEEGK